MVCSCRGLGRGSVLAFQFRWTWRSPALGCLGSSFGDFELESTWRGWSRDLQSPKLTWACHTEAGRRTVVENHSAEKYLNLLFFRDYEERWNLEYGVSSRCSRGFGRRWQRSLPGLCQDLHVSHRQDPLTAPHLLHHRFALYQACS